MQNKISKVLWWITLSGFIVAVCSYPAALLLHTMLHIPLPTLLDGNPLSIMNYACMVYMIAVPVTVFSALAASVTGSLFFNGNSVMGNIWRSVVIVILVGVLSLILIPVTSISALILFY